MINISSVAGRRAIPGHAVYAASKFALEGWSEGLRSEVIPYNVFVSLVEPGIFATEIFGRNLRRVDGARSPYARLQAAIDSNTRQMQKLLAWADPRRVAEMVAEIALSERPRLRYPVGVDAWVGALTSSEFWRVMFEQRMMRAFRE